MTATERRQRDFARFYVECGNTVQSAIKAGYSEKYANAGACKLLDNVRVMGYIEEYSEQIKEKAEKELKKQILSAAQRQAILSEIASDDAKEPADRINAIDKLNKMTGEYITRVEAKVERSEKLADILSQIGGEGLEE